MDLPGGGPWLVRGIQTGEFGDGFDLFDVDAEPWLDVDGVRLLAEPVLSPAGAATPPTLVPAGQVVGLTPTDSPDLVGTSLVVWELVD